MTSLNGNLQKLKQDFYAAERRLSGEDRERLLQDQVKILQSNLGAGLIGQVIVGLGFLYFIMPVVEKSHLAIWSGLFVLSLAFRFLLYLRMKSGEARLSTTRLLGGFVATVAFMGAVWGSIILFHVANPQGFQAIFAGIMVAALATVAVFNGVAHRLTILAFLIPAMTPFIIHQLAQGQTFNITLGLLAALFSLYLIFCGLRMNRLILEKLMVEIDNEKLLATVASVAKAKAIEHADERLRHLMDQLGSGVVMIDNRFRHVFWNKTYEKIFGFPEKYLKPGLDLKEAMRWYFADAGYCEEDVDQIVTGYCDALEQGKTDKKMIHRIDMADGRIIDVSVEFGADGSILLNYVDVTKREKANAEALFHMGQRDSLTGLPNRFLLKSHLKKVLGKARDEELSFALILFNVDNFQFVNETYGLSTGDMLINSLALRLETMITDDEFLAHLGGDSFAIISEYYSEKQDVLDRTYNLLDMFRQPSTFFKDGQEMEIIVGMSAGVTFYPDDNVSVDDMLLHAAIALSITKKNNPGDVTVYKPTMHAEIKSRNILVTDIRDSLATSQFILHYQPQVELKSRKISGVEALLRWRHPERGWISPAEFIPLAELSKQIVPLTEQFLPVACLQARAWQDQGMAPFPVSVNISPLHFLNDGFVPMIRRCLDEAKLEPKWLELEITEGIIMSHSDETIFKLNELADMGVQLAIDDFGTGYSSLTYLRALPVSKLKIDQAFIADMVEEGDARSVIEAIIRLGHSFNLKIIAEGVENEQEFKLLKDMRCDIAQGYYFSRPLTPEKMSEWVGEYSRKVADFSSS